MLDKFSNENNEIQNNLKYDFLKENNITLFSFSSLKPTAKITLSPNNSFYIKFYNKGKIEFKKEKNNSNNINNKKNNLNGNNNNSLKALNIQIPSSEKLLKNKLENDFILDYNSSFANFCGINKIFFKELFINNRYIPYINELGDINISIKSIIDILKNYSYSLILKIHRFKINRVKKLFKTYKKQSKKKPKNILKLKKVIKKNNNFSRNEEINKLEDNHQKLYKDFRTDFINDNIKMFNFKKQKISIQRNDNNSLLKLEKIFNKQNFIKDYKNIMLNNNNNVNNNEDITNSNYIQKMPFFNYNKQKNEILSNNIIFNSFSNDIQNNFNFENINKKDFLNKKRTNTSISNNIKSNYNIPFNNQILNPITFSPKVNIIAPSSYYLSYNNLSSSNLFAYSPFYNIIDGGFIFGDTTRNSLSFGNNSHINHTIN